MEAWKVFAELCELITFKKNEIIKRDGNTEKYGYFIISGSGGVFIWKENNYVCLDLIGIKSMIRRIKFKFAINTMLILLILVLCFHLLILIELIPYQMVWGGRLKTKSQMYSFETVSIVVNLIIMAVILIKGGYIETKIPIRIVNILLWVLVAVFILNTLGNLFSNNFLEMVIFTPLTLISAILCYRMAVEKYPSF